MEGSVVGEPSPVAAGGELDRTAATTETVPSIVNLEWGKAACSKESVKKWTAADIFRPGELVEWRAPTKDETPSPSTMEDHFVILSLNHISCGLRIDASDFLVSVLAHYGIEWSHLTPNSITALSIFAHLCEGYLGVPPTVEVFTHFYRLYRNNKGETTTLGGIYFRLRDKLRRIYPIYYLKASQFEWTCLWFYAKLPQSCRLTFEGHALEETNRWRDELFLSPEQEKQVLKIEQLSKQGLTGEDIILDYLKHRISPLRRRTHLACNYTGPTDPTRDSDKDLSEEDLENKITGLLDLRKTAQKEPPRTADVPMSLITASAHYQDNQPLGLLYALRTLKTRQKAVEKLTGPITIRKSLAYKSLVPASARRYTRQSAAHRKIVVPPEIDSSPVQGHSDLEDEAILEARTTIRTAIAPKRAMVDKSIDNPAEMEEGKRLKTISSIIGKKRKFYASRSRSKRKTKYSSISIMAKTRMPSLGTGCTKGTLGSARPLPSSSVKKGKKRTSFNVVNQNKVAEVSMPNVPLDQHVRDSPPKEVNPAQCFVDRDQQQEAIQESALTALPNLEEINSEAIWERMQKIHSEYVASREMTLSELLEQAKKLFMENKRLKDERIMVEQQVKNMMRKTEQEALKRIEENTKLKDETIRDQKKMIDELSERNKSTEGALVQKCTEVNHLKEQVALLIKDKEELQSRVLRANDLLQLMTSSLGH